MTPAARKKRGRNNGCDIVRVLTVDHLDLVLAQLRRKSGDDERMDITPDVVEKERDAGTFRLVRKGSGRQAGKQDTVVASEKPAGHLESLDFQATPRGGIAGLENVEECFWHRRNVQPRLRTCP
jgi:hypothetical protein